MLTPSPKTSPSSVMATSPTWTPIRKPGAREGGRADSRANVSISPAAAPIALPVLGNSTITPSPRNFTIRPPNRPTTSRVTAWNTGTRRSASASSRALSPLKSTMSAKNRAARRRWTVMGGRERAPGLGTPPGKVQHVPATGPPQAEKGTLPPESRGASVFPVQRCAPSGALRVGLCRERLAAAAGRLRVRIPDLEAGSVQAVDEIDVSAHQIGRTELVDEEVDAVDLLNRVAHLALVEPQGVR